MERISSRRNPLCLHLKKLGASRDYRELSSQFLCDGIKLLEEAVIHDAEIIAVLTSADVPFPLPVDTKVYFTERGIIDSLSPMKNAQDTLFSCSIPKTGAQLATEGTHILLDSVQDPGNVGTIIRTANAFRISSVILTEGCADPYNPKTIRASMGAIFRQTIQYMSFSELSEIKISGKRFIGASTAKDCRKVYDVNYKDAIIVIGSEGRGISEEISSLCSEKVTIPISQKCESLNAAVAAAILIWESARQDAAGQPHIGG